MLVWRLQRDALREAEQIVRVILLLDPLQPRQVIAVISLGDSRAR